GRAALQILLTQKQSDRTKVLEVLGRSNPDALPADALMELLREDGPEAPMAASLLGASRSNGAVDALLRYLSQPSGVARRQVLLALGKIGDRRTAETIAKDLFSDDPEIRAAAAEALGSTGGPAEVESLQALKGDYYREVRESAERALHKLGK